MARRAAIPTELTRGPFTVAEAERAGLTRRQLEGRTWRRLGVGLYAWAGLPDRPELVLAAINRRLPAGAAFSGRTAAWLHGLDLPPCAPVELTVPPGAVSTLAGQRFGTAGSANTSACAGWECPRPPRCRGLSISAAISH